MIDPLVAASIGGHSQQGYGGEPQGLEQDEQRRRIAKLLMDSNRAAGKLPKYSRVAEALAGRQPSDMYQNSTMPEQMT